MDKTLKEIILDNKEEKSDKCDNNIKVIEILK